MFGRNPKEGSGKKVGSPVRDNEIQWRFISPCPTSYDWWVSLMLSHCKKCAFRARSRTFLLTASMGGPPIHEFCFALWSPSWPAPATYFEPITIRDLVSEEHSLRVRRSMTETRKPGTMRDGDLIDSTRGTYPEVTKPSHPQEPSSCYDHMDCTDLSPAQVKR